MILYAVYFSKQIICWSSQQHPIIMRKLSQESIDCNVAQSVDKKIYYKIVNQM